MRVEDFIQALPKAELHLHLEGAAPWAMVRAASVEPLPETPPWWADDFKFANFDQFREASRLCSRNCLSRVEQYGQVAGAVFQSLAGQNVRYVEISFDMERLGQQGFTFMEVTAAIKQAAPAGLHVGVFGGLSYHKRSYASTALVGALLNTPNLDGIDLHGDGAGQDPALFADIFAEARRKGLLTKAHAGELAGPESVIAALEQLQVKRIEHGVQASHDEALLDRLAAEAITLDMCPWSNVKLGITPTLTHHPIRQFHRRGIPVTINTDDPTIFGYTLSQEIGALVSQLDFAPADLAQLQRNAFRVAKLPETVRAAIDAEIHELVTTWSES